MSVVQTWTRKSFDVEAVRLTEENLSEAAEWCNGTVSRSLDHGNRQCVYFMSVAYGKTRATKAFAGHWIVKIDHTFKHYRDESFRKSYMPGSDYREPEQTDEAIRSVIREEFGHLLKAIAKRAYDSDGYETGELESAALRAIKDVTESVDYYLPHGWSCKKREYYGNKCDCGVGDTE